MGLVIENVSKHYGAVIAIKTASMSIEHGEVRAILGGNGSGKSTLAKLVGGMIGRNSGKVVFDGKEVEFKSPKEAKDNGVIITSQELSLFGNLTVEENICICNVPCKKIFTDKKELKNRAANVLKRMNLEHLMGVKVSKLPPNQQYMVELAKALVQNPKILIIDEITSALYREDVEVVEGIIKELKEQGCIILFISHRMNELYAICDSVTVMRNGEVIGTYPMQEKDEDELLSLMVGSKVDTRRDMKSNEEENAYEVIIRANNIKIPSYGTTEKLEIRRGEVVAVAGLQGHGQTDLLRSFYGLNGNIELEVDGKVINVSSPEKAVAHGFAFVSGDREKDGVFAERNLRENVSAVTELVKRAPLASAKQLLDDLHVRYDNENQLITALSGGNQQKVVVGRWLATNPKLLLADDPTKGIDVKARSDLHKEFVDVANEGNAVIMVSSDNDELVNITSMASVSKVIVMYEGRISAILKGNEITRENISAASMPTER